MAEQQLKDLLFECYQSSKTFGEFVAKLRKALKDAGAVEAAGDDIPPPPDPPPPPRP